MTEVMNFFQTIITFKNYAPAKLNAAEMKLAVALKAEAQEFAAVAAEERRNGRTTQKLSSEAETSEKRRVFAEIAVWHNSRAAEKYAKAAARFEEAGRIYKKKSRAFNNQAEMLRERAGEASEAVIALNEFLKQN